MATERLGDMVPVNGAERTEMTGSAVSQGVDVRSEAADESGPDADHDEAVEFVRFCYRRRSVAWPELYDEMCLVAARGEYRGMGYEQLGHLGIGFTLPALPSLAALVARVVAEERGTSHLSAVV